MNKNTVSTHSDQFNKLDQSNHTDKRKKVYVVGNGWASYYFCKNLDKSKYEPIVIAPNEKVLNTTKLIDLIFDETVSAEFPNPHAKIINGKLLNIDFSNKKLILYNDQEIKFDSEPIVLAIGSEVNDYGIDGVKTHAYFLKTKDDAYKLGKILKNDDIYNICVIGSGPTGIELCSALNVNNKLMEHGPFVQINLVEAMTNILPSFSEQTKEAIKKHLLLKRNTQIFTDMPVTQIMKNCILTNLYPIKSEVSIWTGGVKFNGYKQTLLFETLNQSLNENNKITPRGINVNDDFSIDLKPNFPNNMSVNNKIYCLGDMVANKGPPTAQNAKHQAKWLANYFNKQTNKPSEKQVMIEPFIIPNNKETVKLLHLRDKIYVESQYYNGFMPQWMNIMIEHFY